MRLLALTASLLLLAGCGASSTQAPSPSASPTIQVCDGFATAAGQTVEGGLPDVEVECLQGEGSLNLSRLRGPMLMPVWASWCVPCSEEMPVMQQFADRHGEAVRVLGIALLDETSQAIAGSVNWGVDLPSLEDPDGVLRPDLGVTAPPTTLFIDAEGRIVHREFGAVTDIAELEELVRTHLGVQL